MKAIKLEKENGEYKVIPVEITYDEAGDIDYIEDAWLFEDDVEKIYVIEYNGHIYYPLFSSMEEIEDEFEEIVVDALKNNGYFREVEYSDDPDDDDEICEFRLFTFAI